MKLFCLSCNKPTSYDSVAPRFCSHCGKPYVDVSNTSIAKTSTHHINPKPIAVKPVIEEPEYEEDSDNNTITTHNIDQIECDIDKVPRINRETIGKVTAEKKLGIGKRPKSKLPKKIDKKSMEQNWFNAFPKSSRKNPSEIE